METLLGKPSPTGLESSPTELLAKHAFPVVKGRRRNRRVRSTQLEAGFVLGFCTIMQGNRAWDLDMTCMRHHDYWHCWQTPRRSRIASKIDLQDSVTGKNLLQLFSFSSISDLKCFCICLAGKINLIYYLIYVMNG
jgi:hypothetical protein